ncbi:MAG: tetratricopeptide repeat protein [Myxococcales bacterium]|nr:tetratricopeptide repeat protein [Myxococcales bacterium]
MDEAQKQQLLVAREQYHQREYDKAAPMLRALIEQGIAYADVHNMLGVIEHSRGEFVEARRQFEAAVALNGLYTEALINLSVTLNELGQFQESREIHSKLAERGVGSLSRSANDIEPFARGKLANLHAEVADAYAGLGLLAEAAEELRKALALCPTFADLRTRLGNVLRDAGRLEEAEGAYRDAIASNPRFLPPRIQLGVARFSRGDRAGAELAWEEALAIEPSDRFASMYLRMSRANRMRPSMSTMQAVRAEDAADENKH